jgi:hypothetical protein
VSRHKTRPPLVAMLVESGIYQVGLGVYFVFARPSLLPEDARFMRASRADLLNAAPALESWLHWVFVVLGGQMAGAGILLVLLAQSLRETRRAPAVIHSPARGSRDGDSRLDERGELRNWIRLPWGAPRARRAVGDCALRLFWKPGA